jgi:hypothetical protein
MSADVIDKKQPHPLFKLATELGPLIVFFVANSKFGLFAATGAFMVAIVAAMIASYVVVKHVPIMAIVTAFVVLVFGEVAGVTGLVMTKLDGTARGGVLVAAAERFGLPIHAIGVGESLADLRPFDAREVARIIAGVDTGPRR